MLPPITMTSPVRPFYIKELKGRNAEYINL